MLCRDCLRYNMNNYCECTCHHTEEDWECENIEGWSRPIDRYSDEARNITTKFGNPLLYKNSSICYHCKNIVVNDEMGFFTFRFCPYCGLRIEK